MNIFTPARKTYWLITYFKLFIREFFMFFQCLVRCLWTEIWIILQFAVSILVSRYEFMMRFLWMRSWKWIWEVLSIFLHFRMDFSTWTFTKSFNFLPKWQNSTKIVLFNDQIWFFQVRILIFNPFSSIYSQFSYLYLGF